MADNEQLVTIDLEKWVPEQRVVPFDIVPLLFMEFVLKEEDFRKHVAEIDWKSFNNSVLAVFCSNDAIIPTWAFMLLVSEARLNGVIAYVGSVESVYERLFLENIGTRELSEYAGKRILLKGCAQKKVPVSVYAEVTRRLIPIARRVMYGEACSFVPVFKGSRSAGQLTEAS
jgi:hypothetical protein